MECREFREVSEAYLSDELLVETNLKVFRHLENCPNCRKEFAAKRDLRQKMKNGVAQMDRFQIDPNFANRLSSQLKDSALQTSSWKKRWFTASFLLPAMASILVVASLSLVLVFQFEKQKQTAQSIAEALTKITTLAVGNHKHCALDQLGNWEELSKEDFPKKAVYTENVVKPLQESFSENVELLHTHHCIFEGKEFTHIILKKDSHIISVFVDQSDKMADGGNNSSLILSNQENGMQVASFEKNLRAVFVISDLTETENLSVARTISGLVLA